MTNPYSEKEELIIISLAGKMGWKDIANLCSSVSGKKRPLSTVKSYYHSTLVHRKEPLPTEIESLRSGIEDALKSVPAIKPLKSNLKNSKKEDDAIIVACMSDWQVGSSVDAKETGGLGSYNSEIFKQRVSRLFERVLYNVSNTHYNVKRLDIDLLGDIIDGATIFNNHGAHIDIPVPVQITHAAEYLATHIRELAALFPQIQVNCVVGNHGRIGKFGESKHPNNIEYILYDIVKLRTASIKNVKWNISPTWWTVVKRFDKHYYLAHGDDFRSWLGIPFYGAMRYKQRVQELVRTSYKDPVQLDYIEVGHHHQPAEFSGIIMNGNMVGASDYSAKQLQVGGLPSQKMFFTHPLYGVGYSMDIYVENPNNLPSMPIN